MAQILKGYHEVRALLEDYSRNSAYTATVADVRQQLGNLVSSGFMTVTPLLWLQQFPRYMKAIKQRFERLQGNQKSDEQLTVELAGFWTRYEEQPDDVKSLSNEVQTYRWMVEEYRVSIFAQSLGTKVPVSAKRLEKQWLKTET